MIPDKEQFMKDFRAFIELEYRPGGILVSNLGHHWKMSRPETDWQSMGFLRMSQALFTITDAPDSNWEVLERGTPHMTLLKRGDTAANMQPRQTGVLAKKAWIPRLVEPVWLAFLNELKWGKRFLNRGTGEVRVDVPEAPDASAEWIEIVPIPQEEQRQWAHAFLAENSLAHRADLHEALERTPWYLYFAQALRATPPLSNAWNAFRTHKVTAYVEAWCTENAVDIRLLRAPDRLAVRQTANIMAQPSVSSIAAPPKSQLRQILVAAFARLDTHEMLQVSLPLHAVIEALRPDLID